MKQSGLQRARQSTRKKIKKSLGPDFLDPSNLGLHGKEAQADVRCDICQEALPSGFRREAITCRKCPVQAHANCIRAQLNVKYIKSLWLCLSCRHCYKCEESGIDQTELIYCRCCDMSYHADCARSLSTPPAGKWLCLRCKKPQLPVGISRFHGFRQRVSKTLKQSQTEDKSPDVTTSHPSSSSSSTSSTPSTSKASLNVKKELIIEKQKPRNHDKLSGLRSGQGEKHRSEKTECSTITNSNNSRKHSERPEKSERQEKTERTERSERQNNIESVSSKKPERTASVDSMSSKRPERPMSIDSKRNHERTSNADSTDSKKSERTMIVQSVHSKRFPAVSPVSNRSDSHPLSTHAVVVNADRPFSPIPKRPSNNDSATPRRPERPTSVDSSGNKRPERPASMDSINSKRPVSVESIGIKRVERPIIVESTVSKTVERPQVMDSSGTKRPLSMDSSGVTKRPQNSESVSAKRPMNIDPISTKRPMNIELVSSKRPMRVNQVSNDQRNSIDLPDMDMKDSFTEKPIVKEIKDKFIEKPRLIKKVEPERENNVVKPKDSKDKEEKKPATNENRRLSEERSENNRNPINVIKTNGPTKTTLNSMEDVDENRHDEMPQTIPTKVSIPKKDASEIQGTGFVLSKPVELTEETARLLKDSNGAKKLKLVLFERACKAESLLPAETSIWTVEDVYNFIRFIGFPDAADNFSDHQIDGKSLLLLSRKDVITGFKLKLGPALKIYAHIFRLQRKRPALLLEEQ